MNWSKAKTILIIALVITNVILFVNYNANERKQEAQISQSTKSAVEYMEDRGISINCTVPEQSVSLPVIRVSFIEGDAGGAVYTADLEGIPLEIIGLKDADYIDKIEETGSKIDTLPAYTALLKSLGSVSGSIDKIELVYLVDRAAYIGQGGEDTALPYWKISSGENSYYYSAFAE